MINGITYYKLKSPYNGDITKNCSVAGTEIDGNFFTLEGRDVKSITVEGGDIVLNLLNGDKIKAEKALNDFIINISFDKENGILRVYRNNGDIEEFDGFTALNCDEQHLSVVASDETLNGNGTNESPLKISENYKTGQFKPIDQIVLDKKISKPKVGERFLVSEDISAYGLLYDYNEVLQIACELNKTHSKWRVPSKEDWDDMLNAIEPCHYDQNHDKATPDRYLGKWAGKLLKAKNYWNTPSDNCQNCDNVNDNGCQCGKSHPCHPTYCGEFDTCCYKHGKNYFKGLDKYGFMALPSGYADDCNHFDYFGERTGFWTATNIQFTNIFIKRLDYDKNNVYQGIVPAKWHYSLRLIKDYTGDNYTETENILGQTYPTVLMPSVKNGNSIWTSINVYYTTINCKGCCCSAANPNFGQGETLIRKYFIDEWNGHKWLRNEFKEGDSVVVKTDINGKKNVEYRLVDGILISVPDMIQKQVVNDVTPLIKDVENRLENEIIRSVEKDNYLEKTLGEFGVETKNAFDTINEVLTTSINNINSAIATESSIREESDNKLHQTLSKESEERKENDNELQRQINNKVDWIDVSNTELPDRKAISLKNHDLLLGTDTKGNTYNLAMVSKWDVADYGSNKLHLNLNSQDKPTVNDNEQIAYVSEINSLSEEQTEAIKNLSDKVNEEIARLDKTDDEIKNNLVTETEERKNRDIEIEGKLLDKDTTLFDKETGVIKLTSKDGTNDIQIQLSFNFGQF